MCLSNIRKIYDYYRYSVHSLKLTFCPGEDLRTPRPPRNSGRMFLAKAIQQQSFTNLKFGSLISLYAILTGGFNLRKFKTQSAWDCKRFRRNCRLTRSAQWSNKIRVNNIDLNIVSHPSVPCVGISDKKDFSSAPEGRG